MDVTQNDARGEGPAVWEGDGNEGSPEGVKPPEGAWGEESPSRLDGFDSEALLEALEPDEAAEGMEDGDGGDAEAEAFSAEGDRAEAEDEDEPGQLEDEGRRPPQRLSVRGLPAEQQFQLAEALDLVRRGEAGDVAEALESIKGEHRTSNVQHRTSKDEELEYSGEAGTDGLKERIATLRGERRKAIEDFDRVAEARLTEEIEDLQVHVWQAEQAARVQEEQDRGYQERYHSAVDAMEARYPEAGDEGSAFYRVLDSKVAAAQARRDPALADPGFILRFADEVAEMLGGRDRSGASRLRSRPPVGSALAPGYQSASRPGREQLSRMIQEMPLEELERLVCTE